MAVPLHKEHFSFEELLSELLHDHLFTGLLMDSSLAAILMAAVFRSDASCGNNLHFKRLITRDGPTEPQIRAEIYTHTHRSHQQANMKTLKCFSSCQIKYFKMIQTCSCTTVVCRRFACTCTQRRTRNATSFNRKTFQADIICYTSGWGINNLKEMGRRDQKHLTSHHNVHVTESQMAKRDMVL